MAKFFNWYYKKTLDYSICKFNNKLKYCFNTDQVLSPFGIVKRNKNISIKQFAVTSGNIIFPVEYFENYTIASDENTPIVLFFASGFNKRTDWRFYENYCSSLSFKTESVVILVNFFQEKLLSFPKTINYAMDTIRWVKETCPYWQINSDKLYIMGDFLGANIALSALMQLRKNQTPLNIAGLIFYDILIDPTLSSQSFADHGKNPTLDTNDVRRSIDSYLKFQSQIFDRKINLIREKDFTKFPPTLLLTSKLSPLQDDSQNLKEILEANQSDSYLYSAPNAYFGYIYTDSAIKSTTERLVKGFIKNNYVNYLKIIVK